MSVAGGLEHAFLDGAAVGCESVQIFVKNQRQWRAKPLSPEQIDAYKAAQQETGLHPVVAHASYLINMAAPGADARKKSTDAMIDELSRCEALGVDYLVVHPGAHMDDSMDQGIERIAACVDQAHDSCAGFRTKILLETTAGQGTAIGYRFEQLRAILSKTKDPKRLGVCLDTCHLFAAGYDFRTAQGYRTMMGELDELIGLANVHCIHVNDSKRELGSRVDRHDHIGKGKIGKEGFAHFVNDPRWNGIPMILETAKGKDGRGSDLDKVNLKRLRGLIRS